MIFAIAQHEPTVFLMLSRKDLALMEAGKTVEVPPEKTGGTMFNRVILSLHETDNDAVGVIMKAQELRESMGLDNESKGT